MRRLVVIVVVLTGCWLAGCAVSKNIVEVRPPASQTPLQDLERHINYNDPDAGQPDYVRSR